MILTPEQIEAYAFFQRYYEENLALRPGEKRHRGRPISDEERLSRMRNLQTLAEQGCQWDPREPKIGDTPTHWLVDEMEDLSNLT